MAHFTDRHAGIFAAPQGGMCGCFPAWTARRHGTDDPAPYRLPLPRQGSRLLLGVIRMRLFRWAIIVVVTASTNETKPMKIPSTTPFAALVALTAHTAAFTRDEAAAALP